MKFIVNNTVKIEKDRDCVVALGFFDGIHKGHKKIIEKVVSLAHANHMVSVVHTFTVSPKVLLGKSKNQTQITSMEEKLDILKRLGVDVVVADDFTQEYRNYSPEEFVDKVLVERLSAKMVVLGFHYHFGKGGRGNNVLLESLCKERGIVCITVERVEEDGETISSTAIRTYLEHGEIERANNQLGHEYFVLAKVVKGKQIGRTIGFPTINQNIKDDSIMVKKGVYVTRVLVDCCWHLGLTNVGRRPSIEDGSRENIETYIFDLDRDLYGKTLKVEFLKRLRGEEKFSSLEALKTQIQKDKEITLKYIKDCE